MVANAADERTQTKIQNAFHLPPSDDVTIRSILRKYVLKMDKIKKTNIGIRNRIFTKDEFEFVEAFNGSNELENNNAPSSGKNKFIIQV